MSHKFQRLHDNDEELTRDRTFIRAKIKSKLTFKGTFIEGRDVKDDQQNAKKWSWNFDFTQFRTQVSSLFFLRAHRLFTSSLPIYITIIFHHLYVSNAVFDNVKFIMIVYSKVTNDVKRKMLMAHKVFLYTRVLIQNLFIVIDIKILIR